MHAEQIGRLVGGTQDVHIFETLTFKMQTMQQPMH